MSRDDVVMQRPEDLHLLVPVFHTVERVLRRRDGVPAAPDRVSRRRVRARHSRADLPRAQHVARRRLDREGAALVHRARHDPDASSAIGCSAGASRSRPPALLDWVRQGRGYRGAMLPTNFKRMHPRPARPAETHRRQRVPRGRYLDRAARREGRRGARDDRSVARRRRRGRRIAARSRRRSSRTSRARLPRARVLLGRLV